MIFWRSRRYSAATYFPDFLHKIKRTQAVIRRNAGRCLFLTLQESTFCKARTLRKDAHGGGSGRGVAGAGMWRGISFGAGRKGK